MSFLLFFINNMTGGHNETNAYLPSLPALFGGNGAVRHYVASFNQIVELPALDALFHGIRE